MLDLTHVAGLALLLPPLMIALIYAGSGCGDVTPGPPEASDIGMSRGFTLSLDVAWLAAAPGKPWYYDLTLVSANLLIITPERAF